MNCLTVMNYLIPIQHDKNQCISLFYMLALFSLSVSKPLSQLVPRPADVTCKDRRQSSRCTVRSEAF